MIRARAFPNPGYASTDLYIFRNEPSERGYTSESLIAHDFSARSFGYLTVPEGEVPPSAPFRLDPTAAQTLADDLYRAGFRPSDARATDGQIKAMEAHLADLRLSHTTLLARAQAGR